MKNEFKLVSDYWDCECKDDFIHRREETFCEVCQRFAEEQPESRLNEVKDWLEIQRKDVLFLIEKVDCFGNADIAQLARIEQEIENLQRISARS